LYKEGATRPEIARSTHFNFGTIKKIIDDYEGFKADKNPSKRSQAYTLYESHYKPLSVAIKLDIPADEAEKYYQEYVRLSDFGYLEDIILDNGDLRPFLTLYNELKSRKISLDNLDEIITISRNIPLTKSYNKELNNTLLNLENKIHNKKEVLSFLEYHKINLRSEIRSKQASYIELKSKGLEKRLNLVQAIILDHRILLITALFAVVSTFQMNQEFTALLNKTDNYEPSTGSRFIKEAEAELLEILLTSQVNHIVRSEFQNDKAINP
jgi:hypothetical protein